MQRIAALENKKRVNLCIRAQVTVLRSRRYLFSAVIFFFAQVFVTFVFSLVYRVRRILKMKAVEKGEYGGEENW